MSDRAKAVSAALAMYVVWTAATWLLEGRIDTLLHPEAVVDRIMYAIVGNLMIAIVGGGLLLRALGRWSGTPPARAGFGTPRRTLIAVVAGFICGLGFYALAGGATSDPVIVTNAFAQVLVVSAAEVIVCWSIVGSTVEAAFDGRRRWLAVGAAAAVSSVLFGAYHFAHSAPFNSFGMVAFLSVIGLVTGLFFFVSRDAYGTIVFHNFLGVLGVVNSLAAKDLLQPMKELQPPLLATAVVTILVLVAVERYALRRWSEIRSG